MQIKCNADKCEKMHNSGSNPIPREATQEKEKEILNPQPEKLKKIEKEK